MDRHDHHILKVRAALLVALMSVLMAFPALAQSSLAESNFTTEHIAAWADGFFSRHLDSLNVPGAAFAVVDENGPLFLKGYGISNMETGSSVDPDQTLFQIASVSKLITATAALQLVQSGHVALKEDLRPHFPNLPIRGFDDSLLTLHQLLTHTAGFDERNIGYFARTPDGVHSLAKYLQERLPRRTIPPGTEISYSNHGFGVAGLLVQELSGIPFEAYAERHVFNPLGMTRSTFRLPLPDSIAGDLATGYRNTAQGLAVSPVQYRNVPPAGAMSSTARDMGRFMTAWLGNGASQYGRILDSTWVHVMHSQQFTHHPQLAGMAYGFIEQYENGYRLLQHGGDNPGFGSILVLVPEARVGFFMASNRLSNPLREALVEEFMDRFLPPSFAGAIRGAGSEALTQPVGPSERAAPMALAGRYRLNRYAHADVEKLAGVFTNEFPLWARGDTLITRDARRWLPVAPNLYGEVGGEDHMAFRVDETGKVSHMFRDISLGGTVPGSYERLAWYQTGRFTNEFYLSWVPFLMLTWIIWPIVALFGWIWRKWRGRAGRRRSIVWIGAWVLAAAASVAMLRHVFAFIQPLAQAASRGGGDWIYGIPETAASVMWLPWLHAALAVGIGGLSLLAWQKRYGTLLGRLHYSVLALAAGAWLIFLIQYNFLT